MKLLMPLWFLTFCIAFAARDLYHTFHPVESARALRHCSKESNLPSVYWIYLTDPIQFSGPVWEKVPPSKILFQDVHFAIYSRSHNQFSFTSECAFLGVLSSMPRKLDKLCWSWRAQIRNWCAGVGTATVLDSYCVCLDICCVFRGDVMEFGDFDEWWKR